MTANTQHEFNHKEVVTALIKAKGIHEGYWGLLLQFGFGAGNVGPSPEQVAPTAMVSIGKIGIIKVDSLNNLAVDAAEVNPARKK